MTGIPGGAVGYGLKAVGGAAAQGGSDGRDVVGGGCTPLLARATATNNHPWSIHGGCIRQVHGVHMFIVFALFFTDCSVMTLSVTCLYFSINKYKDFVDTLPSSK